MTEGLKFKWGDRVRFTGNSRLRGRLGMYRSQCHSSFGDQHNILWDGRQTTERVRAGRFEPADRAILAGETVEFGGLQLPRVLSKAAGMTVYATYNSAGGLVSFGCAANDGMAHSQFIPGGPA